MKILLYVNHEKDAGGEYSAEIKRLLDKHGVEFFCAESDDGAEIPAGVKFDAVFAVGGDGTLLRRTALAAKTGLPIVGINIGKLGFLTEFEASEAEQAIILFKNGELVRDERLTLDVSFNGKTYVALNDAVLSRIYEDDKRMVVSVKVEVGTDELFTATGDGVIAATPTGSTAYSLSVGGAVLQPHINAFCITPVAPHFFASRPVVCSAENTCRFTHAGGSKAGLFADGKLIGVLNKGDEVTVTRSEKKIAFLRKKDFDFFARLNKKLQDK